MTFRLVFEPEVGQGKVLGLVNKDGVKRLHCLFLGESRHAVFGLAM